MFRVHVLTLGGSVGLACYNISLSHTLGDGATYYRLLRQLQEFLQYFEANPDTHTLPPETKHPITWEVSREVCHACGFPKEYGDSDTAAAFSWVPEVYVHN